MSTKTAATLQPYHYPRVYKQLLGYAEGHEMHVLLDTETHKHLMFKTPGTGIGHFSLVTWPGYLAIAGDIGEGFIFCREADMLRWFDHGQAPGWINPGYWGEKTGRATRELRPFSAEAFAKWVKEVHPKAKFEEWYGTPEGTYSTESAIDLLDQNRLHYDSDDISSWTDWDHHFLLACHAILWGAKKYHASVTK